MNKLKDGEEKNMYYNQIGKRIVFWGAGAMCQHFLELDKENRPDYIVDSKKGNLEEEIDGIKIIAPDKIQNWEDCFIVITTRYVEEIKIELEKRGLKYGYDFIALSDIWERNISMKNLQEILMECCFEKRSLPLEFEKKIKSKKEYEILKTKYSSSIEYEQLLHSIYRKNVGKMGVYMGYCECCQENRAFICTGDYDGGPHHSWQETFYCPVCHCNSRMRYVIDRVKRKYSDKKIYILERVTAAYQALERIGLDMIGSEYLSVDLKSGTLQEGILHEDAMDLSFEDNTFEVIISNAVYEHVADYKKALKEAYRCLEPGGVLMFMIPVFVNKYKNIMRALENRGGGRIFIGASISSKPFIRKRKFSLYRFWMGNSG